MRAFVAIFPPPKVREALSAGARKLRITGEVRWVRPENVHLTLKFLGEVPENDLERVAEALEPLRARHAPFVAVPSVFGAFPSARRARILWAGIGEGSEPLRALARDVEDTLEPLGFNRERRAYVPHLTLGRARGRAVSLKSTAVPSSLSEFPVRRVELMRSVLGAAGSTYSTLAAYPLSEGRD